MEDQLIQVRLREGSKSRRYLMVDDLDVKVGDWIAVQDEDEEDLGIVTGRPVPIPVEWEEVELPEALEIPDEEEIEKAQGLRAEHEPEAIKHAYEKVREHNLDMKLVQARYYHRSNKMRFHFTSENRVDFRELVKDLANVFHARIELRQVGVRDAAGMVGGHGLCGEELCCSRFLDGFDPVTIRMAKDQNLALNPSKISGCCGRLLCCLKYEHETYVEAKRRYPKNGFQARIGDRYGKVTGFNLVKDMVSLYTESQVVEIPLEEFREENPDWRNPKLDRSGPKRDATPEPKKEAKPGDSPEASKAEDGSESPVPADNGDGSEGRPKRRRRRRRKRKE